MHILFVISLGGGPEAYVKVLAPWLIERGHKVTVVILCPPGDRKFSFPTVVDVFRVSPGSLHYYLGKLTAEYRKWTIRLRSLESAWAVERMIRKIDRSHKVDIVEVTEGLPVVRLRKHWSVVVRAHGSDWLFRQHCQNQDTNWDDLLIRDAAIQFKQASLVSPISNDLAEQLSKNCRMPQDKFKSIPYPIDSHVFSPKGEKIDVKGFPILMSIGRLEHRKGTNVLVLAMREVWQKYPEAKLLLLGSPAEFSMEYLFSLVPQEKRGNIVFPGFVDHADIPAYLRSVDIYIAPTQYETLGYTILEAMACGKAVISCPVGAVPELVFHGENGLLVQFGNSQELAQAILYLLDRPEILLAMGRMGRQMADEYAIEKIGSQMEQIYNNTVKVAASNINSIRVN